MARGQGAFLRGRVVAEFFGLAAGYFALAKAGLALASLNPSASPIWPATGFALAAVLLRGYRIAPAIFLGAFMANAATAESVKLVENIFRKMAERGVDALLDDTSLDALTLHEGITDEMWELVRRSAEMPSSVRRAVDALELSTITHDLFELAQKFNSFYHKYPILNEKDPAERQRRAVCAEVFRQTMRATLGLLGIPVPERM